MSQHLNVGIGESLNFNDSLSVVKSEIEKSPYLWVTISGLKNMTTLDESEIKSALDALIKEGLAVVAKNSKTGDNVYTLWTKYKDKSPTITRILDSLSGSFHV